MNEPFNLTSSKAIQFKKEMETIDEMLQNTNTINLDELRSACKEDEELRIQLGPSQDTICNNRYQEYSDGNLTEINSEIHFEDSNFDINQMQIQKQNNYIQAFEKNLKVKKDEIIILEKEQVKLQKEQEVKLIKLSHLKNQRQFYQEQFKVAQNERKKALIHVKGQLKMIEAKIVEYQEKYNEKQNLINQQKEIQNQKIYKLEVERQYFEEKLGSYDQSPSIKAMRKSIDANKDLQFKIHSQSEKISQLSVKKKEVNQNISYLDVFLKQANEEMMMTNEDIQAQTLRKAELVAQREELDHMYDCGKSAAGKEFELFMKLSEVSQQGPNFIQQEYEHLKVLSFFNDIVTKMKKITNDQSQLEIIENKQYIVKQKSCMIENNEIIKIIIELTRELNMEIDDQLLQQKFMTSSKEKDLIYDRKRDKLNDVMSEIKRFETMIKNIQNVIENILKPQSTAISQTYQDNHGKLKKLSQAKQAINERLSIAEKDINEMKIQYNICNSQQAQIENIQQISHQINEIDSQIEYETSKLEQYNQALQKLNEDFFEVNQHLMKQKEQGMKLQNQYDPMNASQRFDEEPEDENLRKVLDEIDIKIGQAIEDKEKDNIRLKTLNKQLKEAKDSFSYAYKQLKQSKKQVQFIQIKLQQEMVQASQISQMNPLIQSKKSFVYDYTQELDQLRKSTSVSHQGFMQKIQREQSPVKNFDLFENKFEELNFLTKQLSSERELIEIDLTQLNSQLQTRKQAILHNISPQVFLSESKADNNYPHEQFLSMSQFSGYSPSQTEEITKFESQSFKLNMDAINAPTTQRSVIPTPNCSKKKTPRKFIQSKSPRSKKNKQDEPQVKDPQTYQVPQNWVIQQAEEQLDLTKYQSDEPLTWIQQQTPEPQTWAKQKNEEPMTWSQNHFKEQQPRSKQSVEEPQTRSKQNFEGPKQLPRQNFEEPQLKLKQHIQESQKMPKQHLEQSQHRSYQYQEESQQRSIQKKIDTPLTWQKKIVKDPQTRSQQYFEEPESLQKQHVEEPQSWPINQFELPQTRPPNQSEEPQRWQNNNDQPIPYIQSFDLAENTISFNKAFPSSKKLQTQDYQVPTFWEAEHTHELLYQQDFQNEIFDDASSRIEDCIENLNTSLSAPQSKRSQQVQEQEQGIAEEIEKFTNQYQESYRKHQRVETFQNQLRDVVQNHSNNGHPPKLGDMNENLKSIHTAQKDTNCKSTYNEKINFSEFSEKFSDQRKFDIESQEKLPAKVQQLEVNLKPSGYTSNISSIKDFDYSHTSIMIENPNIMNNFQWQAESSSEQLSHTNHSKKFYHQNQQENEIYYQQQIKAQQEHDNYMKSQQIKDHIEQQIQQKLQEQKEQQERKKIQEQRIYNEQQKIQEQRNQQKIQDQRNYIEQQKIQEQRNYIEQQKIQEQRNSIELQQLQNQRNFIEQQAHILAQQYINQNKQPEQIPMNYQNCNKNRQYSIETADFIQDQIINVLKFGSKDRMENHKPQINIQVHNPFQQQQNFQQMENRITELPRPLPSPPCDTQMSRLLPLLQGSIFYKKFSNRQSLYQNAFDPLKADKIPPENCGYGIRFIQLDKSLRHINIRQNLKNVIETQILIKDIVKPIMPAITMEIIKIQKSNFQPSSRKKSSNRNKSIELFEKKTSISQLAKIGVLNKNSDLYRQKCMESTYFPFSIALAFKENELPEGTETVGRVELIATSHEIMRDWVNGINMLVNNKKELPKMQQMIQNYSQ